MIPSTTQFSGLTMPVFTAFGWAGEEAAIKFALSQLELFIDALHFSLTREAQGLLPYHGLDRGSQSVYLATTEQPEKGLYIAFFARPMSLEISLNLKDKATLNRAFKAVEGELIHFHRLLAELGPEWNLRIQQMEYDEETETATHYQDIYKDPIASLDIEKARAVFERAAFLNTEEKWLAPLVVSYRLDSEKAAAMGRMIIKVMGETIVKLLPLIRLLTGQVKKGKAKPAPKAKARRPAAVEDTTIRQPSDAAELGQFTYVSELKPLHIQRGFINLTSNHWPFFAINARTETRPVTVVFEGQTDKKSAVWRLVPNDLARLVLGAQAQQWLEENFSSEERIQITAIKLDDDNIQIILSPVD